MSQLVGSERAVSLRLILQLVGVRFGRGQSYHHQGLWHHYCCGGHDEKEFGQFRHLTTHVHIVEFQLPIWANLTCRASEAVSDIDTIDRLSLASILSLHGGGYWVLTHRR